MPRYVALAGALFGATGVLLGAFGSHALRAQLSPRLLETWQTAVSYQMLHALALLAVFLLGRQLLTDSPAGATGNPGGPLQVAAIAFITGIILFSGSLYLLCLTGSGLFGPITPVGGVSFVIGWLALAWSAWRLIDR